MVKKKEAKKQLLNKISGYILIALGVVFLWYSLPTFEEAINLGVSLFFPIVNTLSSIALILLGIYVFRIEKWAIILAGVYGVASLINSGWIVGLFSGFRTALFSIAYIILAINWWVQLKK